ncbi:MAG: mechanosensitive ion channel, partial [Gammaproteobacteria bacterium]|nr:mechanosensitive ion channel [Gammaproteobacteria bacterium]
SVCEDPEPRVRLRQFGASSLDFELLCWIDQPVLRGRVIDALNCQVYKRFNEEEIEIPYSKHDLYIKELPKQD